MDKGRDRTLIASRRYIVGEQDGIAGWLRLFCRSAPSRPYVVGMRGNPSRNSSRPFPTPSVAHPAERFKTVPIRINLRRDERKNRPFRGFAAPFPWWKGWACQLVRGMGPAHALLHASPSAHWHAASFLGWCVLARDKPRAQPRREHRVSRKDVFMIGRVL